MTTTRNKQDPLISACKQELDISRELSRPDGPLISRDHCNFGSSIEEMLGLRQAVAFRMLHPAGEHERPLALHLM